jgi:hypothetical protein
MGLIFAILLAATSTCPHVRANGDPAVASLIEEGSRVSATFRRLVDAIDDTNGLVYVERGDCRHGVRACLTLSVTAAGPHRILRILLDLHRELSELLGALGHELQHALEVLGDVHVTSTRAAYLFYQQLAPTVTGRFETDAAIRAGLQVEREAAAACGRKGQP